MSQQGPTDGEIQGFLGELGEVRRGMTTASQRLLDTMLEAAMGRQIKLAEGGDVTPYWGAGTPNSAVGVTDFATSLWGTTYARTNYD